MNVVTKLYHICKQTTVWLFILTVMINTIYFTDLCFTVSYSLSFIKAISCSKLCITVSAFTSVALNREAPVH